MKLVLDWDLSSTDCRSVEIQWSTELIERPLRLRKLRAAIIASTQEYSETASIAGRGVMVRPSKVSVVLSAASEILRSLRGLRADQTLI
jgi:hypothetical protein